MVGKQQNVRKLEKYKLFFKAQYQFNNVIQWKENSQQQLRWHQGKNTEKDIYVDLDI